MEQGNCLKLNLFNVRLLPRRQAGAQFKRLVRNAEYFLPFLSLPLYKSPKVPYH